MIRFVQNFICCYCAILSFSATEKQTALLRLEEIKAERIAYEHRLRENKLMSVEDAIATMIRAMLPIENKELSLNAPEVVKPDVKAVEVELPLQVEAVVAAKSPED